MEYPIFYSGEQVGTVNMRKIGLYMEFDCECVFPSENYLRVSAHFADRTIDLGLLIRENDVYYLRRKISIKTLGDGEPLFTLVPNCAGLVCHALSSAPGQPFKYLVKIRESRLFNKNDVIYIVIG